MTRKTLSELTIGTKVQLVAGKKTYLFNGYERLKAKRPYAKLLFIKSNGNIENVKVPLDTSVYVVSFPFDDERF